MNAEDKLDTLLKNQELIIKNKMSYPRKWTKCQKIQRRDFGKMYGLLQQLMDLLLLAQKISQVTLNYLRVTMDEKLDLIIENQKEILKLLKEINAKPSFSLEEQVTLWISLFGASKLLLEDPLNNIKEQLFGKKL